MSWERSEPAGMQGLGKQVTEAKEGPLELKRKKERIYIPRGRIEGKTQVCSRERMCWGKKGWEMCQ